MKPFIELLTPCVATPPVKRELMAKHTNFRIGGPARYFATVSTVDELKAVLQAAKEFGMPYFILGGGSNTLFADNGFDGLVVKIAFRGFQIDGTHVIADAGVLSAMVARKTAQAGLKGFGWAISLPGTIGGAVRGNAGCFGGETKDYLTKVDVLRDGEVIELTKADCAFDYRESAFKHNKDIVLRAHFDFEMGDGAALTAELDTFLEKRKSSQPLYAGSAGCLFKNTDVTDEDLERLEKTYAVPEPMKVQHRVGSGWLIDKLDLKGKQIGKAQISPEHGNFVVNLGGATADEIAQLIAIVKHEARERAGVNLQEEVQLVGF
jgi:UDP-N-acetylmuramate dehydrogenase